MVYLFKIEEGSLMNLRKYSSFILIGLMVSLLLTFIMIVSVSYKKEEILETKINFSMPTLSAIVFADSDTINDIENVKADVVFEELSNDALIETCSVNQEDSYSDFELVVQDIENSVKESFDAAGNEYIDEIFEASKVQNVQYRGLNFIYDPTLVDIDNSNIESRFKVFAPNDDYNKVVKALSQMALGEAGGCGKTEIAATIWCVLNRFDGGYANSIFTVVAAPGQYHGYSPNKVIREDIYEITCDVIARWVAEKEGQENVGRVLPQGYYWFYGDGKHNHFRNQYRTSVRWDWSLPTPYLG